ncbi:MAG: 5-(carboxyamino)imidazole ribonucleotide synthase [Erysipelotrichaceae bacterium]
MSVRLLPPASIGIVGGGQLGRMMALSAIATGYKIVVLDPDPTCPCASLADVFINAPYDDAMAFERLVTLSDVVTYEFENADVNLVERFGSKFPQGYRALAISQHRLFEKNFARENRVPCPKYQSITSQSELDALTDFPIVLKTCRFGYDGKGQWLIQDKADLSLHDIRFPGEYIAETYIDFEKEISVIACRFKDGITIFEPFENRHAKGILRESIHPARIDDKIRKMAIEATKRLAEALNYIGVLAVEYFVTKDGILFNEMAPRPHNSAHGTIEGCEYSQYDLHIAAITGSNSIASKRNSYTMMINLLGQDVEAALAKWKNDSNQSIHLHWYGKSELRTNRKMGHITVCADTIEALIKISEPWRNNE